MFVSFESVSMFCIEVHQLTFLMEFRYPADFRKIRNILKEHFGSINFTIDEKFCVMPVDFLTFIPKIGRRCFPIQKSLEMLKHCF